jgi:type I restriction enzyme S subunit
MSRERLQLKDICDKSSSSIAQKDFIGVNGTFPIYGASGLIKNVDFYHQEKEYVGIVKDGAGVGRAMLLPRQSSVIGTLQYILPKANVLPQYLYYILTSMNLAKYATGATIPHIYFKDYSKETVFLPSIKTQHEVVDTLNKATELIALRKKQLEEMDALAESVFYDMFGDPVKNEKGWEVEFLSCLGHIARGVSKHRPRNAEELLGGEYPLIQTGDVANAGLYIYDYNNTYSEKGLSQSKLWNKGTLCITIAANIAKTGILKFDACFPDSVVGFMSNKKTNNIFMHYWFGFFQEILEKEAPEVAQKNINLKILSNLKVIVPPTRLQTKFATIVERIEEQKSLVRKALKDSENLFQRLMQDLFSPD